MIPKQKQPEKNIMIMIEMQKTRMYDIATTFRFPISELRRKKQVFLGFEPEDHVTCLSLYSIYGTYMYRFQFQELARAIGLIRCVEIGWEIIKIKTEQASGDDAITAITTHGISVNLTFPQDMDREVFIDRGLLQVRKKCPPKVA